MKGTCIRKSIFKKNLCQIFKLFLFYIINVDLVKLWFKVARVVNLKLVFTD